MKKGLLLLLILSVILSACGKEKEEVNDDMFDKHEGTIVNIDEIDVENDSFEGWYFMLVIPDVNEDIDISEKDDDELRELAREKDGAYYNVPPDIYKNSGLEVGKQIIIYFDKEGQGEGDPPVRDAKKVDE